MASKLYDLKLAGFTSGGNPATGTGILGQKSIALLDDGSVAFTDTNGNKHVINDSPKLNALLSELVVGAGGVSTTKRFHK